MGRIRKGILGGFHGTVGTVVGGTWKGIDYIKSRPVISNSEPTPKQLEQRAKFKAVIDFLRPILPFVQVGFRSGTTRMTGFNSALSYNFKHALTGSYPNFSIDFSFVAVTAGALPNVLSPVAAAEANSVVKFSWQNNSIVGMASPTDQMMLVVYCPALKQAIYTAGNTTRSDGEETLDCAQFAGQVVHTYIACISEDGRNIAASIYTGQLNVS